MCVVKSAENEALVVYIKIFCTVFVRQKVTKMRVIGHISG